MSQISKATTEDIDVIYTLAHEIWPRVYDYMISKDQINYMLDLIYSNPALEEQINLKKHQFIIYTQEKKPRAFASYSANENDPQVFRLHKLYVHPELHGNGIGKQLVNYIIDEMKSVEGKRLELNVNKINKSIAFYQRLGFNILYPEVIDIGGGYVMDDYVMGKEV